MRTLLMVLGLVFICLACLGCMAFWTQLRYGFSFYNVGSKDIRVADILIYRDENETRVRCGQLNASVAKAYGGYYNRHPQDEFSLTWSVIGSNESGSVRVPIRLPKLFYNREQGAEIVFFINPDIATVSVAYKVFDSRKQDYILVDSDGNPFDLERIKSKAATE